MSGRCYLLIGVIVVLIAFSALGCGSQENYPHIDFNVPESVYNDYVKVKEGSVLRVGMWGVLREPLYVEFANILGGFTDREGRVVLRRTLSEVNNQLAFGSVEVILTPATSYLWDKESYGLEAIAIGEPVNNEPSRSLIIVPYSSNAKSIADLKGKTFAMSDPLNNEGCAYLTYLLESEKEKPDTFFKNYFYTGDYKYTVEAVASGMVDGAMIENHALSRIASNDLTLAKKYKIIYTSPPMDGLVLVVRSNLDNRLKDKLQESVLKMGANPSGRQLLKDLGVSRFRKVKSGDFDTTSKIVNKVLGNK